MKRYPLTISRYERKCFERRARKVAVSLARWRARRDAERLFVEAFGDAWREAS